MKSEPGADSGSLTRFLELRIPPVVIFGVFAIAMWAIATFFPVFQVTIPFRVAITAFLMSVAIFTGVNSLYHFYKVRTTVHAASPHNSTTLVTSGSYRHTRNPMYLALSLILIGWGIYLSDLLALMLMPAYYSYMTSFQVIPEERVLLEKFREEFQEYADKTPRWL